MTDIKGVWSQNGLRGRGKKATWHLQSKNCMKEDGRLVNSKETASLSFGVQMLKYSNIRKRIRREDGPQDQARISSEN